MKRIWVLCLLLCLLAPAALSQADASPTTGLPLVPADRPYRPVLVEMSNSPEARPLLGISKADIVYEAIYWSPCHTRYQALFHDAVPDRVGFIRGARIYGTALREMWDGAFVSMGGQQREGTSIYEFYKSHGTNMALIFDGLQSGPGSSIFSRMEGRVNPHNAVADIGRIVAELWPQGESGEPHAPRRPKLLFSEDRPSRGAQAVDTVHIQYGTTLGNEYSPSYHYDAKGRRYARFYNGEAQVDGISGLPVTCENIIVQANKLSFGDGAASVPLLETTGEGPLYAFIRGTMIEGRWVRKEMGDPIAYYEKDGTPLVLSPGQTYVQMVPPAMLTEHAEFEGSTATFSNTALIEQFMRQTEGQKDSGA